MDNIDDTKAFNNFFKGISKGKNNYPRDLFSAFYFSLCAQNYFDADRFFSLFQVQFGIPDWLKEINEKVKNAVYENDKDKHSIFFNGNNPLLIKDKENRNKLNSNEKEDIEFVVNSYINGFKTEKRIKKSESAAFYHLKTVLNRKEIINNKDIQSFLLTEIGKMYLNGIGIPQNLHKSLIYFKNALINDPNNLDAQKHMGIAINMKDELDRSITKLNLKSLNEIDFKEALHYGFSFLHGINGFPKSINHAIKYYLKAATIDPYAYCILGNIFRFGIECSQNLKKASKYYRLGNINGCIRSKLYDGILQMHQYNPMTTWGNSAGKLLKEIDNYYFDYKNFEGSELQYSYCFVINASLHHFPLKVNDVFINGATIYYGPNTNYGYIRRKPKSYYYKGKISTYYSTEPTADSFELSTTQFQNSIWFVLFQLKYMFDHGIILYEDELSVSKFKYPQPYLGIDSLYTTSWRIKTNENTHKLLNQLYENIKPYIPSVKNIDIQNIIKEKLNGNYSIKELLEFFQINMISQDVNIDNFKKFVREMKQIVPLDSGKILFSEDVEKAEMGNEECIKKCALSYFYGTNFYPVNYQESFKYYKILAKKHNDSISQMWVAIMLAHGIGVNQNYYKAFKWFEKSLSSGNIEQKLKYSLFLEYYNTHLKNEEEKPYRYISFLKECTQLNHPESLFQYGKLHESDVAIDYGRRKSIEYYKKASNLGHIESTRRLYHVYKKLGMKTEQDELLHILITINDPKYIYKIAMFHYQKSEYDQSLKFINIMLPTKNPKFFKLFADHLVNGFGIPKDIERGKKFYIAAS